jgi:recombination protein RecA
MGKTTDKDAALESARSFLNKDLGPGTLWLLGERSHEQVEVIPTGSLALDIALGIGGIPKGSFTEIYGPESSGKTTLCQHLIANIQRAGGRAVIIDAEHSLDPEYARKTGVTIDTLWICQPDYGEQAMKVALALIETGAIDLVVIDSIAALTPRAEIDGEIGEAHVGLQARLMAQSLRMMNAAVARTGTAVVFTNQLRDKIGVTFGSSETTPGGRAMKFYASIRLDIRRIEPIKQGNEVVGNRTRGKVVKNKKAPPFKVAEFDILFDQGISREGDLIDLGLTYQLLTRNGSWISLGETRLGQGREKAREFLRDEGAVAQQLETMIRAAALEGGDHHGHARSDEEEPPPGEF